MDKDFIPNFKFTTHWVDDKYVYVAYLEEPDGNKVKISSTDFEDPCPRYETEKKNIENRAFNKKCPTVKEYCERWLHHQSANI